MSEERKRRLWPWIATLLIGLPELYVASFGPACWIVPRLWARGSMPQFVSDALWQFYAPLRADSLPPSVTKIRVWYESLFFPENGAWQ